MCAPCACGTSVPAERRSGLKRVTGIVLALALILPSTSWGDVVSKALSSKPVKTYAQGGAIPAEKRPDIIYRCYYREKGGDAPWLIFGQNVGTSTCVGSVSMERGKTYQFTMDAVLDGAASQLSKPLKYRHKGKRR